MPNIKRYKSREQITVYLEKEDKEALQKKAIDKLCSISELCLPQIRRIFQNVKSATAN